MIISDYHIDILNNTIYNSMINSTINSNINGYNSISAINNNINGDKQNFKYQNSLFQRVLGHCGGIGVAKKKFAKLFCCIFV